MSDDQDDATERTWREYWRTELEVARHAVPVTWPIPASILAIALWDIFTRDTPVPWPMLAITASQILLLAWIVWLWMTRE